MRSPDFASSHPVAAAVSATVRFVAKLRQAGERRRVVYGLAALDDHMLRDIGLTRFDVDSALVEPALSDGTLFLAERASETRQSHRAMAQEARAWATLIPEAGDGAASGLARRAA